MLIPLAALALKAVSLRLGRAVGGHHLAARARRPTASPSAPPLAGALVNAVFGLLVAWVLVRYRFPGRRLVDALVDLPFALPTAVAGIALTTLYAENGWLGRPLAALGVKVAFTPLGIVDRAGLHRPAVRGAHAAAGDRGPRRRGRGGRGEPRARPRWQTFARVILPAIAARPG